ncbi:hypothetical protein FOL47_007128 [Perkinsus chesapeaki]|uniref:Membrane-associated progesterone receptor component 1 n=1 Tax=Perkinsus chesapeaki TaxID=330153 RepID=A0A7J6MX02_PERCH|nr:hypothetical protein FOL47_007128 [Perkinsus chesapeaki]
MAVGHSASVCVSPLDRRDLYGPGGRYHLFAGKDATRAFALMSFKPEDIENSTSTEGFQEENWQALQEWVDKYEKYEKVGVLVYPDAGDASRQSQPEDLTSAESPCDADVEEEPPETPSEGRDPPVGSSTVRRKLKVDRRKVGHLEDSYDEDSRRALTETGISSEGMLASEDRSKETDPQH